MLPRTLYLDPPGDDRALWLRTGYPDADLTRMEITTTSGKSDAYYDWKKRVSNDNGRTWSPFEPLDDVIDQRDDGGIVFYPEIPATDPAAGIKYCPRMRRIWPGRKVFEFSWGDHNHPSSDHVFMIENNRTEKLLRYQDGPDYDPDNPFDPDFHTTNHAYPGQRVVFGPDGVAYFPMVVNTTRKREDAGIVLMRRDPTSGDWTPSNIVRIDPRLSWRGLLEPDMDILRDGRILIVCRAAKGESTPCRKWCTHSTDGGRTLADIAELKYDDGSQFYAPGSIHRFLRSSRNKKLYWLANIVPEPDGDGPRYPLYLAEIDEDRLAVKKDTLILVDDRRIDEGDTEKLQLSNFFFIENRETLDLEIFMTRIGQTENFWNAGVHRYAFTPPE